MSGRQSAASAKERVEAANAETIKHLKAAVSLTEESKNLGSESAESLARQRESIERSLVKADEVEAHNAKSKHILRGMGSLWGAFKNLFTRTPKDAEVVAREKEAARAARKGGSAAASGGGGGSGSAAAAAASKGGGAGSGGSSSSSSSSGGSGAAAAAAAPLTEEEELLRAISGNLGALKAVGEKIGEEIKVQDSMLDELGAKVSKGSEGLKRNTKESLKQARG